MPQSSQPSAGILAKGWQRGQDGVAWRDATAADRRRPTSASAGSSKLRTATHGTGCGDSSPLKPRRHPRRSRPQSLRSPRRPSPRTPRTDAAQAPAPWGTQRASGGPPCAAWVVRASG